MVSLRCLCMDCNLVLNRGALEEGRKCSKTFSLQVGAVVRSPEEDSLIHDLSLGCRSTSKASILW